MILAPEELLGSLYDEQHSVFHAAYRTATRTLCGLTVGDLPSSVERHGPEPTCPTCVEVARKFDRIDGSAPDHWGWEAEAA